MKIRYTVLAREELTETLKYYEAEAGLETAVDFFAEFESVKSRIAANPRSFPENKNGRPAVFIQSLSLRSQLRGS